MNEEGIASQRWEKVMIISPNRVAEIDGLGDR
jgi:hypothetical protein